jgi:hypothetical protein
MPKATDLQIQWTHGHDSGYLAALRDIERELLEQHTKSIDLLQVMLERPIEEVPYETRLATRSAMDGHRSAIDLVTRALRKAEQSARERLDAVRRAPVGDEVDQIEEEQREYERDNEYLSDEAFWAKYGKSND